jgi:endonuclease/exonuclease/phosphatase family metal-dependent hydrolase
MELCHHAEEMAQEILTILTTTTTATTTTSTTTTSTTTGATAMGSRKEVSILLLGDFNSEPHESTVRSILCSEKKKDDDSSSSKLWHYQTAYSLPLNQDKPIENDDSLYTTWKYDVIIFFYASHSSSTATTSGDDNGKEGEDG